MRYHCCEERRLAAVKGAGVLNGIEYVEVSDSEAPTADLRQRTLFVRLLQPPAALTEANVVINGGDRIPTVGVEWVAIADALPAGEDPALVAHVPEPSTMLLVRTESRGDFSLYTLQLVAGAGTEAPPGGFDPLLVSVEFSFKVECEAEFDCRPGHRCPRHVDESPPIDYLAKDYGSFRRLMLDRLSLLTPDWTERNAADLGLALVELMAYAGDELSYRQDAAATEAYLETARLRTSLRRHARLVDYAVHEGSNARVWATMQVLGEGVPIPRDTPLLTRVPDLPPRVEPGDKDHRSALRAGAETFETAEDAVLYESHDTFDFWTWGDESCCLPRGATSATLVAHHPALKAGDILILQEIASPKNGRSGDADPAHRAAVRLTHVVDSSDPSGGLFATPPANAAVDVTEIVWDEEDALRFSLCISAEKFPGAAMARARGNTVLALHGWTVLEEEIGGVPDISMWYALTRSAHCDPHDFSPVPPRFRPRLKKSPLTHKHPEPTDPIADGPTTAGIDAELAALSPGPELLGWLEARGLTFSAGPAVVRGGDDAWSVSDGTTVALLRRDGGSLRVLRRPDAARTTQAGEARGAQPSIRLVDGDDNEWLPRPDLLASGADAREFVIEIEHDRTATVRFGDGTHGRRPDVGTQFKATYRVGNGSQGNIGADSLAHLVSTELTLVSVANLIPAEGGTEPEAADAIRRDAPEAFLVQQRAVTADDYARRAERRNGVQRAATSFRWTGSWHTVFVTTDRTGAQPVDERFETSVREHLEPFRMAGYDLEVDGPLFVPLEIALFVCVDEDHFRSQVNTAVLDRLSSGVREDGSLGLFHPDMLTFGEPVYRSAVVAEAQTVPGVESVIVETFQRQRDPSSSGIDSGVLAMGRLEIPRLDGDPSFPERGVLTVTMGGGK